MDALFTGAGACSLDSGRKRNQSPEAEHFRLRHRIRVLFPPHVMDLMGYSTRIFPSIRISPKANADGGLKYEWLLFFHPNRSLNL